LVVTVQELPEQRVNIYELKISCPTSGVSTGVGPQGRLENLNKDTRNRLGTQTVLKLQLKSSSLHLTLLEDLFA
jgi:hypothetical protein